MAAFSVYHASIDLAALARERQLTFDDYLSQARFEGPDLTVADCVRLEGQLRRIYGLMQDAQWRSLSDIERATGDPQASISSQLRHLRKIRFGGHTVNRRRRGGKGNLWEYQLIVRL